ncbi:PRC-barrel domain-containing protein [Granulicella aggregans]|uniref:PRC-barrel domain-containing protein n=1 Tax=Granulicella aggregans TaxID=474949 RepID=UPI0021E0256D|nr:PRC-barrel domain-containing protein [Granulicella aggregans]
MLIKAKHLKGYRLNSTDGTIGSAREFYFDDQYWSIRYLVARTAGWLSGRQVLLSPYSVIGIDPIDETVSLSLTKQQIENSPSIDDDEPVSRQFEESYYNYYGYPPYWGGPYIWGSYPYLERDSAKWSGWDMSQAPWNRHLRSTQEVTGYHILASDGEIGHVEDFVIDEETWAIRYLVVATTDFWPGKKILVSPQWVESINWETREVVIDLSRERIKNAPAYVDDAVITRDYESGLYGYYDRDGYWVPDLVRA